MRNALTVLALALLAAASAFAQTASNARDFEEAIKNADDVLWHFRVGDFASVDKVHYTSPKPERTSNPTGRGAGNPMIIPAYVFTPKNLHGKAPLIVLVHGGVHGDFNTFYAHIVRELIDQGYVIVAPEYRGSTGYGGDF